MSCFIHKISPDVIKGVYECHGCGKEFIPKPVTAVSEEKCQCTENHACCLEHAGKRGFLNSDPKTWKAASKEERKGCIAGLENVIDKGEYLFMYSGVRGSYVV